MTRNEAHNHIVDNTPKSFSTKAPTLQICEEDDIRTWVADIECTNTGETGSAMFDEHYGEIEINWN